MRVTLRELTDDAITLWNPPESGEFVYIDIASIDADAKCIVGTRRMSSRDAPSRARQIVAVGDVLVSTVRPNLNAVALIPSRLHGAIASTGFCVLRPRPEVLDSRYLFHWVRSPIFVAEMARRATGASYPAVSDGIVRAASVPRVAVEEQRRIGDVLDRADAIRRKRREALALTDELLRATFLSTVGPAAHGYATWPEHSIEALANNAPNAMRTGPFGSDLRHSEFVASGIAVLGIDNAVQNRFAWGERRFITREKFEALARYRVFPGDVIVTIMGTTGRTAVVPDDMPEAITTKHLATITLDRSRAEPEFVAQAIHTHPAALVQITQAGRGSIMEGLNLGLIRGLRLRVPPIDTQRAFVRSVRSIRILRSKLEVGVSEADALFAALQHRAFRGEL